MTAKKLSFAIVLFVIYEAGVWSFAWQFLRESGYFLVEGGILSGCGVTLLALYVWVSRRPTAPPRPPMPPPSDPITASPPSTNFGAGSDPVSVWIGEARRQLARRALPVPQKSALSSLPLYLICGSGGTGKTSLVLASGLNPALLAGQGAAGGAVTGLSPLANIWLAGDSLLLEEGGLQAAEPAQWKALWQNFAPARPGAAGSPPTNLRGVILCCDLRELLGIPDLSRQMALARSAGEHLRMIAEAFGTSFPVYVAFTRSDAIPYFGDYFGRLSDTEREQILGCTLPDPPGDAGAAPDIEGEIKRVGTAFNNLYVGLAEKRLVFLRRESDRVRKTGIYEFPRELRRVRGSLVQYLVSIPGRDPAAIRPWLRGFYFSGALEATEASPGAAETVRWTFAADLFRQLLGPAAGSAPPPAFDPQQRRRSNLIFAWASMAAVAAALLFFFSWYQNRALLRATQAAAAQCEPLAANSPPAEKNLRDIDALRRQVETLTRNRDRQPPLTMRLGFYAGNVVMEPAGRIYFTRLRQYFLDEIAHRLEAEFAALPATASASYPYVTIDAHLKAYRTMTSGRSAAGAPGGLISQWLLLIWRDLHPSAGSDRIAQANFDFYCNGLQSELTTRQWRFPPEDASMVERARAYLKTFGTSQPGSQ